MAINRQNRIDGPDLNCILYCFAHSRVHSTRESIYPSFFLSYGLNSTVNCILSSWEAATLILFSIQKRGDLSGKLFYFIF